MSLLITIGVLVAFVLALRIALRSHPIEHHPDEPQAWRDATLIYAEELFKSPRLGMVARIDRAYLVDGQLELVELKTRTSPRVHASDVIELSVQRAVLQERTGRPVSRRGWVLIEDAATGRRRPLSVLLHDETLVFQLRDRARELRRGAEGLALTDLRGPSSPRACEKCGQRAKCTSRRP